MTGFCFSCGKIRRMKRDRIKYTCEVCKTRHEIHKDRVEIIVKKEER